MGVTYFLALLGEAYGNAEQPEEGLKVLGEALSLMKKTGERYYEAELYRLKGTLVLQSGVRDPESEATRPQHPTPSTQAEAEAEAYFLQAIEIARRQQAKSLELQAVVSLARLWQQQEK
jgi:predicted ATPase